MSENNQAELIEIVRNVMKLKRELNDAICKAHQTMTEMLDVLKQTPNTPQYTQHIINYVEANDIETEVGSFISMADDIGCFEEHLEKINDDLVWLFH